MESAAVSVSLSAIAVLVSKYVATVVAKSIKEMEGDAACPRIWRKKKRWDFYDIGGGADWNGNKSEDDRIASADYRQLINSKIVLVIRTIGDILIIDRCGGHCGACDREVV